LRKAQLSHGVTAGAETFAMTKGTVAAFEIIGTVVMIQADKVEELAVTATAMV